MIIKHHIVEIVNKQGRYLIGLTERIIIRRAVKATLDYEGIYAAQTPAFVSVSIVNDLQIHKLNIETRGIDRSTDVLSFPMLDFDTPLKEQLDTENGTLPLGDIVISYPHVKAQAKEYGHSERRELAFLVVHSMLHLLGYDHVTSEEDEKEMFDRQEKILISAGFPRV